MAGKKIESFTLLVGLIALAMVLPHAAGLEQARTVEVIVSPFYGGMDVSASPNISLVLLQVSQVSFGTATYDPATSTATGKGYVGIIVRAFYMTQDHRLLVGRSYCVIDLSAVGYQPVQTCPVNLHPVSPVALR